MSLVAETGVLKKSVSMRKLKLRELNAGAVLISVLQRLPGKKPFAEKKTSETGRIRFRGVRFQTPNSVSFLGLTEFRGASSVSSS